MIEADRNRFSVPVLYRDARGLRADHNRMRIDPLVRHAPENLLGLGLDLLLFAIDERDHVAQDVP